MSDARIAAVSIEEEFHLLDLVTRQLLPRAEAVLHRLPADRFAAELLKSVVETNSRPCADLEDLRADLLDLRRQLAAAAELFGLGPAAAGTVPIVHPSALSVSRDPRYVQMTEDYQLLAREQLICGMQVHVDVADRDQAMAVVEWVAPWLPMLLALSSSSPYWKGVDSGYASMRMLVWQRWPTSGAAGPFRSAAEYDQLVADLVKSGVISDPGMIYFDVRPSAHLPAVELRVCDACPNVDTVILVAALFRALVSGAVEAIDAGASAPPRRAELVRAATWRAARSGMEGELVDTSAGAGPIPAEAMLHRLLAEVRPQLERAGDWELTRTLAEQAVGRGSSASRQRHAFARRGLLTDVADLVLAETRDAPPSAGMLGSGPGRAGPEWVAPTVLGRYRPTGYDEVVDATGAVRPHYRAVMRALDKLGPEVLEERVAARIADQIGRDVVFRVSGEAGSRPFPFDLVPRIVAAADWARLREGLAQRVRALEAFLRDTYSEQSAVADGIVPAWVVHDSPGLRHTGRAVPADSVRVSVSGIDLVCDGDGRWLVLEDNIRVPSGVGYAIESRRLTESSLPELSPPAGMISLDGVPAMLHEALVVAAPKRVRREPSVAVVTSGPTDSAYFEHTFLAEEMGVPLAEPSGLLVIDDTLHLVEGGSSARSRPRRVDVVYRRIDEDDLFMAPGADGTPLGPSLLRALRAGTLAIANAPGNGVGDDKVLYAYVPRMVSYYLGEQPLLDDVPTYVCGDPEQLDYVLGKLAELVVKPVDGYGGAGVLIGPQAEPHELTNVRELLLADPGRWVAQEPVNLSTHPTWHDSRLEPCAVDLRAFVYQGAEVVVAPAALSRVAPPGSLIVNSSRGGGSKDTWLLRS